MKLRSFVLLILMTALTAAVSVYKVTLSFTPVPVTLQSAACLITGALLGASYGALSMLLYVLLGALGLPVFAGMASGSLYLLGPTGGYIIGFIPCAYLAGRLSHYLYIPRQSFLIQFAAIFSSMAISTIFLYLFGAAYFAIVTVCGFMKALSLAVLPFMWFDLIKIAGAAFIVRQLYQMNIFCAHN